ncbi:hypothetical protein FACS1894184_02210 [Clostridia bacterium]|nr:hypothetical protein FACS1894184_02210 [Clostridia bacterium]
MIIDYDFTDGWYYAKQLGDGIIRISDCGSDNIYLVEGDECALLFDTGHGAGDLLGFLDSLTNKPVTVVISHCHTDHAGACDLFDTVYGGAGDIEGLNAEGADERRANIRKNRSFPDDYVLPRDIVVPAGSGRMPENLHGMCARRETLAASDGQTFDLSGRTLRVLLTPGHSPGSLCLLDETTGALFTGDTYVPHEYWGPMWLHISHSTKLSVYLDSLRRMRDSGAKRMLSGHGECGYYDIAVLEPYINLVESIIGCSVIGSPIETFIGAGLYAGCPENNPVSSIVYSLDKL